MKIRITVYDDGDIAAALFAEHECAAERMLYHLGLKWQTQKLQRDNKTFETTNIMGGNTDWFILPHSYGVAVAKTMLEQKTAGLVGFDEYGFNLMIRWLIEMEEILDCMCY